MFSVHETMNHRALQDVIERYYINGYISNGAMVVLEGCECKNILDHIYIHTYICTYK